MKPILSLLALSLLVGCATSDPMVTGKPQDWQGRLAADLRTGWGEPTRIVKESNGDEVWIYSKEGDRVIPKGESTSFAFGAIGTGSSSGTSAGFSNEKRPEDRLSHE